MRRIHRLRRDQREDVLVVLVAQFGLFLQGQILVGADLDIGIVQLLAQKQEILVDAILDLVDDAVGFLDLFLGRAAVHRSQLDARCPLLLEAADALHEEFVDIGTDDGDELDPLEQRVVLVLGLGQHALVEFEPRKLAVEVVLRIVQLELEPVLHGFQSGACFRVFRCCGFRFCCHVAHL